MNSKKFVSILTTAATVALTTGAAFLPLGIPIALAQPACSSPTVTGVAIVAGYETFTVTGSPYTYFLNSTTWGLDGDIQSYAQMQSAFNASQTIYVQLTNGFYPAPLPDFQHVGAITASTTCVTPTPPPQLFCGTPVEAVQTNVGQYYTNFAVDYQGNFWLPMGSGYTMDKYSPSGTPLGISITLGPSSPGPWVATDYLVTNPQGKVYLSNSGGTPNIYSSSGALLSTSTVPGATAPLAVGPSGKVYAYNYGANSVNVTDAGMANLLSSWSLAGFGQVSWLAVDEQENVYLMSSEGTLRSYTSNATLRYEVQAAMYSSMTAGGGSIFTALGTTITQYDAANGSLIGQFSVADEVAAMTMFGGELITADNYSLTLKSYAAGDCGGGGGTITEVVNGKMKLDPGQSVVLGPPAVINGGLEGSSDNTVTVQGGYVRVDGSVKLLDTLVIKSGATLEVTGGLELTGSLTIESGATLIVGGKLTCPGALSVTNNGSTDIGNNQCSDLTASAGSSGSAMAVAGGIIAALAAGLGVGYLVRRRV